MNIFEYLKTFSPQFYLNAMSQEKMKQSCLMNERFRIQSSLVIRVLSICGFDYPRTEKGVFFSCYIWF